MKIRSRKVSKRKSRKVSKRKSRKIYKRKSRKVSKRKPRKVSKKNSRKRSRRKRKQKILRAGASSKKPSTRFPVAKVHQVDFVPGKDKSIIMKTLVSRNPKHGDLVENVHRTGYRTEEVYVIKKKPAGSETEFEMSDLDDSFSDYGHIGNGFSIGPKFPSGYWFNAELINALWEAQIEPVGVEIWSAIKPADLNREVRRDEYDEDDVVFWKYEKPWGVIKFRANSAAEVCNALKKYKTSALAAQGGLTLYMVEGEIIGSGHDISWDAIKSL
jgi:hypothetical protein